MLKVSTKKLKSTQKKTIYFHKDLNKTLNQLSALESPVIIDLEYL